MRLKSFREEKKEILETGLGFKINQNMVIESMYLKFKYDIELDTSLDYSEDLDILFFSSDPDRSEKYWDERFPEEMKELFKDDITSKEMLYCFGELDGLAKAHILSSISPENFLSIVQDVDDNIIKDKSYGRYYFYEGIDLLNQEIISLDQLNHFLEEWDYGFVNMKGRIIMRPEQFQHDIESCLENYDFDLLSEEVCKNLLNAKPEEIIETLKIPHKQYQGYINDYIILNLDEYIFGRWYIE